jgi:hypothetical protein
MASFDCDDSDDMPLSDIPNDSILALFNNPHCGISAGAFQSTFHDIPATIENIRKLNDYLSRNSVFCKNMVACNSSRQLKVKILGHNEAIELKVENLKSIQQKHLSIINDIELEIEHLNNQKTSI